MVTVIGAEEKKEFLKDADKIVRALADGSELTLYAALGDVILSSAYQMPGHFEGFHVRTEVPRAVALGLSRQKPDQQAKSLKALVRAGTINFDFDIFCRRTREDLEGIMRDAKPDPGAGQAPNAPEAKEDPLRQIYIDRGIITPCRDGWKPSNRFSGYARGLHA